MKIAANQKILDRELQDGEDVLYLWEGKPRRKFLPHVNEHWRRIFFCMYMVGYGVLLGWMFFEANSNIRYIFLMSSMFILLYFFVGKFFYFGPFATTDIQLSNFELSVVTNRRILVYDREERIANMPLNDFRSISVDFENGSKIIQLRPFDKSESVIFPNDQRPSLIDVLRPLIRDEVVV